MKPKGEFLRSLRKQEKDAKAKYEIEVPLLFLLFRVYGCWSEQFYDKLEKAGTSVTSFLPGKSEAEKRRDKDAVNTLPSLIYAKVRRWSRAPGRSLAHSLTHSLSGGGRGTGEHGSRSTCAAALQQAPPSRRAHDGAFALGERAGHVDDLRQGGAQHALAQGPAAHGSAPLL